MVQWLAHSELLLVGAHGGVPWGMRVGSCECEGPGWGLVGRHDGLLRGVRVGSHGVSACHGGDPCYCIVTPSAHAERPLCIVGSVAVVRSRGVSRTLNLTSQCSGFIKESDSPPSLTPHVTICIWGARLHEPMSMLPCSRLSDSRILSAVCVCHRPGHGCSRCSVHFAARVAAASTLSTLTLTLHMSLDTMEPPILQPSAGAAPTSSYRTPSVALKPR